MKNFFLLSCVSLAFIISSAKVGALDEHLRNQIRGNPIYRVLKDTPEKFSYELNNPYKLTEQEESELDTVFKEHGTLLQDDGNELILLSIQNAQTIRSDLLEKMIQCAEWNLNNDPSIRGNERVELEVELKILQKVLANKNLTTSKVSGSKNITFVCDFIRSIIYK